MGVLDDIGYLKDGELTSTAVQGQINSMITIARLGGIDLMGVPIGLSVPEGDLNYLSIETDLEAHEEKFPQFHKIYLNFYKQVVTILNIEAVNILKPIGITDPTQPIVDLINNLREQFESLIPSDIDAGVLVINVLPALTDKETIKSFTEFLESVASTSNLSNIDLEPLEEVVDKIFQSQPEVGDEIKSKIEEEKETVLSGVKESAEKLFSNFSQEIPEFKVPDPLFNLQTIGFDDFDLSEIPPSLFSIGEPPGVIGFLINFLKKMVAEIIIAIAAMQAAAFEVIGYLADGVTGLINFIIDKLLGPIRKSLLESWPDIEKYIIPASFFTGLLLTIMKIVVVVVIGILIGSGLVVFGAAKTLKLT